MMPTEVRARLGIGQSQLFRLVRSGELKLTSGPRVDGLSVNRFFRGEVEELRRQRQSFKQKRVCEGGSRRFGKPVGPWHRPVIEMITPPVSSWLANAEAEGVRLTGDSIHRRLSSEGYKVGIASVYVCLRKVRSSRVRSNKTGGALPQAPPSGYVSSPHATNTPTGEASAGA
jgi:hypothetical protein